MYTNPNGYPSSRPWQCSASIGLYTSATNASFVNDLLGTSYSIGASVADELAVGGSYDFCDKYKGGTLYLGMGGGKSFDVTSGETLDVWHGNIYDIVDGWCDDILEWD